MAGEGHPKDALHELLDGRLQAEARARVEEHIASCTSCRGEIEALRLTKLAARRAFAAEPAPSALRQTLLEALDHEDRREQRLPVPSSGRSRPRSRLVIAAGLAASV